VPVEVITRPSRSDEPGELQIVAIKSDGDIAGDVRACAGPWHMEEGWWRPEGAARAYWDVELARGGSYRVYRDGEWFVEAAYG
jgi:hypothetical protein